MLSVSDMLKILDQIPAWKALRTMPGRMDALEKRLDQLETRLTSPAAPPHLTRCATCGGEARVIGVRDHPAFAELGHKLRTVECAQGHRQDFHWNPAKAD